MEELKTLHERADKHRRSAIMREAYARRAEGVRKAAAPGDDVSTPETRAIRDSAGVGQAIPADARSEPAEMPKAAARRTYEALKQDWDRHLARADRAHLHAIYVEGFDALRARMEALTINPDLDPALQLKLSRVLTVLDEETTLRREVEDYLVAVEGRIAYRNDVLEVVAVELRNEVADHHGYGEWRAEIERLAEIGGRLLAGRETYGDHLQGVRAGELRLQRALDEIRETLARDDRHLAREQEQRRTKEQTRLQDETKKQSRKVATRRKGRYQSWGIRM